LPYVNTELFTRVLADFAQAFEVGEQKRILLVIDPAGWHISQKLKIPEGIHLLPLPSHSPELQPAERLWPIVNEPIANRSLAG
jgi:transposase